jgi:hypothetical protein
MSDAGQLLRIRGPGQWPRTSRWRGNRRRLNKQIPDRCRNEPRGPHPRVQCALAITPVRALLASCVAAVWGRDSARTFGERRGLWLDGFNVPQQRHRASDLRLQFQSFRGVRVHGVVRHFVLAPEHEAVRHTREHLVAANETSAFPTST